MSATEHKIKKGLIVYSKGADTTILSIEGVSGEIFSVSDNLIGLIHHVSDISGTKIFEIYSDNIAKLGKFGTPALIVRESTLLQSILASTITAVTTLSLNMALLQNTKRYLLQANLTINFSTDPISEETTRYNFIFKQDATGSRTVTWNSVGTTVLWKDGTTPVIKTAANAVTIVEIIWTGSEYLGYVSFES